MGARHTCGGGGAGPRKVPVPPWGPVLLRVGGSCRVPGGPMECPHCAPPSCPSPRPPASPTEGRGLPPRPILAADLALGFLSPLWRPSPTPLGCLPTPGGCPWDTQVPEKRGRWGRGGGPASDPRGFPGRAGRPRRGRDSRVTTALAPLPGVTELLGCPAPRTGVEQARLAPRPGRPSGCPWPR